MLDGEPDKRIVKARRYLCVACRCVMIVVPAEMGHYVRFSLPAILAALAYWALQKLPAGYVLRKMSPSKRRGNSDPWLWSSLRRWVKRRHTLFAGVYVAAFETARATAAALVAAVVARMPQAPAVANAQEAWIAAALI